MRTTFETSTYGTAVGTGWGGWGGWGDVKREAAGDFGAEDGVEGSSKVKTVVRRSLRGGRAVGGGVYADE